MKHHTTRIHLYHSISLVMMFSVVYTQKQYFTNILLIPIYWNDVHYICIYQYCKTMSRNVTLNYTSEAHL